MSSARSIGRLFIDIEARTAKLEQDMARAKAVVNGATGAIKAQGDTVERMRDTHSRFYHNLTQRMAGMFALFTVVKSEVLQVYRNIEKIPGVRPETLANIQQMKSNLADARHHVQLFVASGVSGFSQFGTVLGTAASGLVRFFEKVDFKKIFDVNNKDSVLSQLTAAFRSARDEITVQSPHAAMAGDIARQNLENAPRIEELRRQITDMERRATLAAMSTGAQVRALREESDRAYRLANSGAGGDTVVALEARLRGHERMMEANQKEANISNQLATARERLGEAQMQQNEQLTSRTERVEVLRARLVQLVELEQQWVRYAKENPSNSAEAKEALVNITNKMTAAQLRLNSALRANGELARDLGNALAGGFGRAILSGEKLSNVLRDLIGDLLQIILQRTVLSPMADLFTGGILKILGGRAMGGPLSGPVVVGEKGPELLMPSGFGTIIPNEQLRGGRSGATYYIDAKGADTAAISRLETLLMALAGPGAVERRAVNAVQGASWRRQLSMA